MLRSKQSWASVESVLKKKRKATVGMICRKGRFQAWNERVRGDGVLIIILTYNDRTVTHLHIKWGAALGPIVVGAGTRHLPPSRIHAPVTNPR